jgi:hypothetical protein
MHLIVLTDAAQGHAQAVADGARPDPQALLVRWSPLMLRLVPGWGLADTPEALNTLAERARAQLFLGRAMGTDEDGCLPLQAWSQDGSDAVQRLAPASPPSMAWWAATASPWSRRPN